jgi:carbamoyltransferase
MRSLGFSVGHDKGAVLIEDGKVVVGITQERLSRIKHDGAYKGGIVPFESIEYCLNERGLTYKDIDLFVYSTTEIEDTVDSQLAEYFKSSSKIKVDFIPHHLAHAYSSFFSSGFDESAVVVADASGSILTHLNKLPSWYGDLDRTELSPEEDWTEGISIFHFTKEGYDEVYKKWIKYPVPSNTDDGVSLGILYSTGCLQLIFEPNSNTWPAGKLMGMASYADPKVVDDAPKFVIDEGNDIFIPNHTIYPKVTHQSDFFSKACVAGIYQREQERASVILSRIAKTLTDSKNICTAGGSFLNCNSNEQIIKSGLFDGCFFIPPADDSGIPLGCAWYGYQQLADITKVEMISPYFGKTYSDTDIVSALNKYPYLNYEKIDDIELLTEKVSSILSNNRVIGWYQDGSEIGPRALGNRSIIASPIPRWMSGYINSDIKQREWYRPFAPAVLFEHQSDIFNSEVYSPHMLVTTTVKEEWRDKIPSVTHVDNTARYQSVTKDSNPKFYKLISKFYDKTGVPVVLNTSFNGPKEPIIENPLNAIQTALEIKLDYLIINNYLITTKP